MRTHTRPFTIVLFSALMLVVGAAQQLAAQTIRGKLVDQYTNQPIAGATITLVTPQNAAVGPTAKTANDGSFSITAPFPGTYRLRANVAGYITATTPAIDLIPGDQLNIPLRPIAISSNDRPNSHKLSGFEQRMQQHGFGYFITRDKIQQMRPFSVTDLL